MHKSINPSDAVSARETGDSAFVVDAVTFADSKSHTVQIDYDGTAKTLTVNIDSKVQKTWASLDLNLILGSSTAYIGFTASTGGSFESHHISSWTFSNSGTAGVCANSGFDPASNCLIFDDSSSGDQLCSKMSTCDQCYAAVGCCSWSGGACKVGVSSSTCSSTNVIIYYGIGLVGFVVLLSAAAIFIYYRRSQVKNYHIDPSLDDASSSSYSKL